MDNPTPWSLMLVLVLLAWVIGCATQPQTVPPVPYDPPIADEDQIFTVTDATIIQALDVFPAYDDWERINAARLAAISPKYHDFAERIRSMADVWVNNLAAAVAAYQDDGSDENLKVILQGLEVLRTNIAEAKALMK